MEFTWPLMENNIDKNDLLEVIDYLSQDDPKLTHGPLVRKFEAAWSNWLGVKNSVFVNSGSSANDLSMKALKILKGSGQIIVPPLTWVSDIASVLHENYEPIFVDINLHTLGMDTDLILDRLTKKTKGVFLTHILGLNALTDELLNGLKQHQVPLIEDVCESHGAFFRNSKLGTFGLMSNFSFYYAHHMTTIEGGMVSTNDFEIYELLRSLRSHGLVREFETQKLKESYIEKYSDLNKDFIFLYPSHNMRPTEIQAIIGISQLKRLDKHIATRKQNYEYFLSILDNEKYFTEFFVEGNSNYALTLMLRKDQGHMSNKVENKLIELKVEFRRGLSGGGNQLRQPYLQNIIKWDPKNFPNVEHVHFNSWYLGNYPSLSKNKIEEVVENLNKL